MPGPTDTEIQSSIRSSSAVIPYTPENPSLTPTPSDAQFCLALYSYIDSDPAILNFGENDVIEIINQHPSGWWDGLTGSAWNGQGFGGDMRRGWVPSNYLKVLTGREEARAALIRNGKCGVKL